MMSLYCLTSCCCLLIKEAVEDLLRYTRLIRKSITIFKGMQLTRQFLRVFLKERRYRRYLFWRS
jgi:hypothetical protein